MMRLLKITGAAFVVVLSLSAIAVTGASAHEFETSIVPTTLSGSAEGPQTLTTKAASLVCSSLARSGQITTKVDLTFVVLTLWTNCVMSSGPVTAKPDEPIHEEAEYDADGTLLFIRINGLLALLGGVKCTITVQKQGPLSTISYANKGTKEILITANVKELLYNAAGAGCKAGGTGTAKDGTYVGNSVINGGGSGTIGWK